MKPKDAVVTFGETLNELKVPILFNWYGVVFALSQTIRVCLRPWLWPLHIQVRHLRSSHLSWVGWGILTGSDTLPMHCL